MTPKLKESTKDLPRGRRHIRGFLEPCVLLLLHLGDSYGYDLTAALSSFGLGNMDSSLVYRMLRDLEEAGLVGSEWHPATSMGPARRFYRITPLGEVHLADWVEDLRDTDSTLHYFLEVFDRHVSEARHDHHFCLGGPGGEPDMVRAECIFDGEMTIPEKGGNSRMKVVVSANGYDLEAAASQMFGRCPVYVFVDAETMEFEAVDNPAVNAGGGAGIQAAQFVVEHGAQGVLTGNVGPNAYEVFQSANVPIFMIPAGTVGQAVEAYKAGQLQEAAGASVRAHAGMRTGGRPPVAPEVPAPALAGASAKREREMQELRQISSGLRRDLARVMERIEKLEESQ